LKLQYFKNVFLAEGHTYRSQGHRPWWMNQVETFWPKVIYKAQALKVIMAVGQE
jgi:hypothetical protein